MWLINEANSVESLSLVNIRHTVKKVPKEKCLYKTAKCYSGRPRSVDFYAGACSLLYTWNPSLKLVHDYHGDVSEENRRWRTGSTNYKQFLVPRLPESASESNSSDGSNGEAHQEQQEHQLQNQIQVVQVPGRSHHTVGCEAWTPLT